VTNEHHHVNLGNLRGNLSSVWWHTEEIQHQHVWAFIFSKAEKDRQSLVYTDWNF